MNCLRPQSHSGEDAAVEMNLVSPHVCAFIVLCCSGKWSPWPAATPCLLETFSPYREAASPVLWCHEAPDSCQTWRAEMYRLVTTQPNVYTMASREQSHPVTCVQLPIDTGAVLRGPLERRGLAQCHILWLLILFGNTPKVLVGEQIFEHRTP